MRGEIKSILNLVECANFERARGIGHIMRWEGEPLHHAVVNGQSGSLLGSRRPCECRLALKEGSWS